MSEQLPPLATYETTDSTILGRVTVLEALAVETTMTAIGGTDRTSLPDTGGDTTDE